MGMHRNTRTLTVIAIIITLVAAAFLALYFGPTARTVRGDEAAKAVMLEFGSKLKNVSHLGDDAAISASIEAEFGAFVTPELLAAWKANHTSAPGRAASSSAPDRVGIASVTTQGEGRVISGEVILVSAGESIDTVPFVAQLIPTESGWKIVAYQEEKVQTLKKLPTTDEDIPGAR